MGSLVHVVPVCSVDPSKVTNLLHSDVTTEPSLNLVYPLLVLRYNIDVFKFGGASFISM